MRFREPFNASVPPGRPGARGGGDHPAAPDGPRPGERAAFAVYGGTLILLYGASTLYHVSSAARPPAPALRTLDHIAIYFLIAGTYTPVALVTLHGRWAGRCWRPSG